MANLDGLEQTDADNVTVLRLRAYPLRAFVGKIEPEKWLIVTQGFTLSGWLGKGQWTVNGTREKALTEATLRLAALAYNREEGTR